MNLALPIPTFESSSSYSFSPLVEDGEIRLLTLLAAERGSKVSCKLSHANLHENPKFKALSYAWGDPKDQCEILLHDQSHLVTRNLEVALQHLRDAKEDIVLWVDAVCINQRNTEERNTQVRMMGRIYQCASQVLAWLGEEAEDSGEAIDLMLEFVSVVQSIPDDADLLTPQMLNNAGFDAGKKAWGAFWKLWQRPYWKRIWIIQEQHFAGNLLLNDNDRCLIGVGNRWVSRSVFTACYIAMLAVAGNPLAFATNMEAQISGTSLEPFRSFVANAPSPATALFGTLNLLDSDDEYVDVFYPFPDLIRITEKFQATDPRDRVFALQGMITAKTVLPPIDYASTFHEVMRGVVQFAIEEHGNLAILESNRVSLANTAASWYPVFREVAPCAPVWVSTGQYQASGTQKADIARFSANEAVLHIRGVVLGTSNLVLGPFLDMTDMTNTERDAHLIETWYKIATHWRVLTPQKQNDLWRTLILDQERHGWLPATMPAPDSLARPFEKVMIDPGITIPEDFEPDLPEDTREYDYISLFVSQSNPVMHNHCYFETETGYVGMGPFLTKPGDLIVLLLGGAFYFVLRPKGEHYQLLGEAWVKDMMSGQLTEKGLENVQEFAIC